MVRLFLLSRPPSVSTRVATLSENQADVYLLLSCVALAAALLALAILLFAYRRSVRRQIHRQFNSDALLHSFINATKDLIYLKDEHLCYIFINSAFEEAFQVKAVDLLGKDDFWLGDPQFAEHRRASDQEILATGSAMVTDFTRLGQTYEKTKFPVRLASGRTGVGAIIRNVTVLRSTTSQQQKNLRRNQALLDVFTQTFSSTDDQLSFIMQRVIEMTGSRYGCIYLYNDKRRVFTYISCADKDTGTIQLDGQQKYYDLDKSGLFQDIIAQAAPLIINDLTNNTAARQRIPEGLPIPDRFMAVPVIIDNRVIAVVALADKIGDEDFDDGDVFEATLLISGAWQAVERKMVQDQLIVERNKYLQTLISIGDGVMLVDRNGRVEMLNLVGQQLTGWHLDEAHGRHYSEVFPIAHEIPGQVLPDPVEMVIRTGQAQEFNNAVLTTRDGTQRYLEDSVAPILDDTGKSAGVVMVFRDATSRQAQRRRIEYLSFHDTLTGLYNRRFFEEELQRIDTPRNWPISIVMGDVNGLKLTNDVFGHTAGDELLKGIADALGQVCRSDDIIARWGGDEFILLLPNTPCEAAETIISRIKQAYAGKRFSAMRGSISMGAACKTGEAEDMEQVLNLAEERMYLNKAVEQDSIRRDMIDAIVARLHKMNSREKEHAENVSALCEQLGRRIGLPEVELRRVRDAGYLHDIGKVVLDPRLLNKNYIMTEEEWSEIKKHPIVGYRILTAFDHTVDLAEPVLAHQEHWDGSGYPKGLKGEEIPLLSRIIALAEGYERLLHDSDNREAYSLDKVIAHIRSLAGSQYEPDMAEAFIRLIESSEKAGQQPGP